jgi:hypothetical protein
MVVLLRSLSLKWLLAAWSLALAFLLVLYKRDFCT